MDIVTGILGALAYGIPGLVVAGLAMILMLLALIRKDPSLMIFAALLFIPFAYTRGTWMDLRLFVRLMPLFLLGSAWAINRNEPLLAWVLPLPTAAYLIYVLFSIIASDF